jgi:5-carboxymethyl-2-hydroxymuconate isomerase
MFANEMNTRHFVDKKLQNDFLLNTIRSRKRPFAKWAKSEKSEDIECIKHYFNVSDSKALEISRLLSKEQIQVLKQKIETGGLRK